MAVAEMKEMTLVIGVSLASFILLREAEISSIN